MKQLLAALLAALLCTAAFAQQDDDDPPPPPPAKSTTTTTTVEKKAEAAKTPTTDHISTTSHSITINGQTIAYTARAGTMIMKDDDATPRASIFFVSYTRDGADPAKRPVTYTFNGGPGSSSVWLHMGAFGPKRVAYADDEGHAARPPYHTVDNDLSLLDVTDLVFIDPVTTGYSRAIPFKDASKFHSVESDVRSVGEFIRLWTTRYSRWSSPKFLAGESYGTTRAAGLSGYLHGEGIYINGIALISSILNFGTARFDSGNDLPYIVFLPTYSAIAWYHKRLPSDLQSMTIEQLTSAAEQFALGDYTAALVKGDTISDADRKSVAQRVARFTGLTADYVERANLRVRIDRFDKELLRDQRRSVGRLDGRFTGIDKDAAGETPEFDPSYSAIMGEYTAVLNDYLRRDLKFETDLPYEILTGKVSPWSYDRAQNRYVDVGETLRGAMAQNPYLKVFVGNGYYDLATPFAATRYTFNRMQLDPEIRKNVTMDYFEAGHMMYIDRRQHARLVHDIREFIRGAY
jgi:carboxypeptidase C (cathepsin A)